MDRLKSDQWSLTVPQMTKTFQQLQLRTVRIIHISLGAGRHLSTFLSVESFGNEPLSRNERKISMDVHGKLRNEIPSSNCSVYRVCSSDSGMCCVVLSKKTSRESVWTPVRARIASRFGCICNRGESKMRIQYRNGLQRRLVLALMNHAHVVRVHQTVCSASV